MNKDSLLIFLLLNMSKSLDLQYNGIRLIKVINQRLKKKESKENHTFFLIALVLMK